MPRATTAPTDVFINVPFDDDYENTFLALIASLVGLGLNPRCVLEVPPYMPFELGLSAAIALDDDRHQWRVLERVPHRVAQSLSDISGYDPTIHGGTVCGTIDAILDIFGNVPAPPLSEANELLWVYRRLRRYRSRLGAGLYRANSFKKLVLAAKGFVIERAEGQ